MALPPAGSGAIQTSHYPPHPDLHLTLDHGQHGIGTASCWPGVLEGYRLMPDKLTEADRNFTLTFS